MSLDLKNKGSPEESSSPPKTSMTYKEVFRIIVFIMVDEMREVMEEKLNQLKEKLKQSIN